MISPGWQLKYAQIFSRISPVEAWKNAPNNRDPAPGQHAPPTAQHHPFPPAPEPELPPPPRYKAQIGASSEESALLEQEARTAGDFEAAEEHKRRWNEQRFKEGQAAVRRREQQKEDEKRVKDGVKDITKYLFAEYTWGRGNEREEMDAVNNTILNALKSNIPEENEAAIASYNAFMRLDKDKVKSDYYDKENTFNELARYVGDIARMNEKLQELIRAIDGAADKYNNAEVNITER